MIANPDKSQRGGSDCVTLWPPEPAADRGISHCDLVREADGSGGHHRPVGTGEGACCTQCSPQGRDERERARQMVSEMGPLCDLSGLTPDFPFITSHQVRCRFHEITLPHSTLGTGSAGLGSTGTETKWSIAHAPRSDLCACTFRRGAPVWGQDPKIWIAEFR